MGSIPVRVTKIKQVEHQSVRLVLFIQTEGLVWNHRKVHGISRTATVWHQSLDCIVFCFSLIPYATSVNSILQQVANSIHAMRDYIQF